jgi:hypothetical protein
LNSLIDGDNTSESTKSAAQFAHNETFDRWHCRLDHSGRNRVRELMRNGELLTNPDTPICDTYVREKQIRESFTDFISTAAKSGDVIHSDVLGPIPPLHSGCRYAVLFIDEHSRYVSVRDEAEIRCVGLFQVISARVRALPKDEVKGRSLRQRRRVYSDCHVFQRPLYKPCTSLNPTRPKPTCYALLRKRPL